MLHIKSKKITLPLCLCIISALLSPALSQADTAIVLAASETGTVAASQAADQKAALAKKAANRQKAAEAQAEAQKTAEEQKAAEEKKEKAAEK
jgi:type IV secretory pathway VirB6-like protein